MTRPRSNGPLAVLDFQTRVFAHPLRPVYDLATAISSQLLFKVHVLPTLRKRKSGVHVYAADSRAEALLEAEGISFVPFRHVTESLWDHERGCAAMDLLDRFSEALPSLKHSRWYHGIDIVEMTRKDLWRTYLVPIINAIRDFDTLLDRTRPDSVLIFDNTSLVQSVLIRCAEMKGIRVEDRTSLMSIRLRRLQFAALHALGRFNTPEPFRSISRRPHPTPPSIQRGGVLIVDDAFESSKITPWARLLGDQATIVGVRQSPEPFRREGLPYFCVTDFVTAETTRELEGIRSLFPKHPPTMGSLDSLGIAVDGVGIGRELEEMSRFLFASRQVHVATLVRIFEDMLQSAQPAVVVTLDEISIFGRTLSAVAETLGIPSILVQPGFYTRSALMGGSRIARILAYGVSSKRNLMASGIHEDAIRLVGIPEADLPSPADHPAIARSTRTRLRIADDIPICLFASQSLGADSNRRLLEVVYSAATRTSDAAFVAKLHPEESDRLHRSMIRKYRLRNVAIVRHGEMPLADLLIACKVLIHGSSSVAFEALAVGRPIISVNVSGLAEDQLLMPTAGVIMSVEDASQLHARTTEALASNSTPETIRLLSTEYLLCRGTEACRNVEQELRSFLIAQHSTAAPNAS